MITSLKISFVPFLFSYRKKNYIEQPLLVMAYHKRSVLQQKRTCGHKTLQTLSFILHLNYEFELICYFIVGRTIRCGQAKEQLLDLNRSIICLTFRLSNRDDSFKVQYLASIIILVSIDLQIQIYARDIWE